MLGTCCCRANVRERYSLAARVALRSWLLDMEPIVNEHLVGRGKHPLGC